MNIIRKSVFLFTVTSLSSVWGGLFAQTVNRSNNVFSFDSKAGAVKSVLKADNVSDDEMILGYCIDETSRAIVAQGIESGRHSGHAAIYLPSSIRDKYEGDKIRYVDFAIKPKRGNMATVFVCTDIDRMSETTKGKYTTFSYKEGWNRVELDNPVTIKKGQGLYVGYVIETENEKFDYMLFDNSSYGFAGRNLYGYDNNWYDNITGINKNLCIRAIMTGDNVPDNDISFIEVASTDGGNVVEVGKPYSYKGYVINNGKTPVTSLGISTSAKGVTSKETVADGYNIPNGIPQEIQFDGVSVPADGNIYADFKVSKVNGAADPDMTDNTASMYLYAIKEGGKSQPHNVLVEEFTSEGYKEAETAENTTKTSFEAVPETSIIWVRHHVNWDGVKDPYRLDQDGEYLKLYGTSEPFLPALAVDRHIFPQLSEDKAGPGPAYFMPWVETAGELAQASAAVATYVKLDATTKVEGKKLTATINATTQSSEMPNQTDLRLTAWLVEDGIKTTSQAGSTDYVHNGVIRKVLSSDAWGDKVAIKDYAFSKTYETELNDSWNPDKLSVVAFVSNQGTEVTKRAIFNSCQTFCNGSSGIEQVGIGKAEMSLIGGKLYLGEGCSLLGIYDMSGRSCSNGNLNDGMYIVKATDGKTVYTKKIRISK